MHPLTTISPLDGRYSQQTKDLVPYFSEMALMRYRLRVEVEYFIALSREPKVKEFPALSAMEQKELRALVENFSLADAERIKEIEATTKHDVKAIEYWLREAIAQLPCSPYASFIHFALTSEDVNNVAYSLMWRDGLQHVYLPALSGLLQALIAFARKNKSLAMLALTHGQSATPTTVGKEFAVFAARLERQLSALKHHRFLGKLNGATGTWAAHIVSYPTVDWRAFSVKFISKLGLEPNLLTTQIEAHDALAESYHTLIRINTILLDLSRDVWLYVMRGVFGQKNKQGEIGSSTMPHKINPIYFENAEGNLGLASAHLEHLAMKLPVSRLQRDLSDSTVLRTQGVGLAHSFLAVKNLIEGFERLELNTIKLRQELDEHWEVLGEAIQTMLRKQGRQDGYEQLKKLTRGKPLDKESLRDFISQLPLPDNDKKRLLDLTPQTYIGLADKLIK